MRLRLLVLLLALLGASAWATTPWRVVAVELPPAIGPHAAQQGYYAVLLRRVLRELDAEPQFVFLPPQRALQAAQLADTDAALPFKRTPERDGFLWFTEPFYIASVRVFVLRQPAWQPGSPGDLDGHTGCTLQGARSPDVLQGAIEQGRVKLERVPQLEACFRLLHAQRVQFVVAGINSGWMAAHTLPDGGAQVQLAPFVLAGEPIQLALPRANPASAERLARFNAALKKLRPELRKLEAQAVPQRPQ